MRDSLEKIIWDFCNDYTDQRIWRYPIVRFADATLIPMLKETIGGFHHHPEDILPGATIAVSYFLPFTSELGESNKHEGCSSPEWASAYLLTNEIAEHINQRLINELSAMGYRAALPISAGVIGDNMLFSHWSQRHVAYLGGHGTFGLNNMLISDKGSCGRYFSFLTDLDVFPDTIIREERCHFKSSGKCAACVKRCTPGALSTTGYNRDKCYGQCKKNAELYNAQVCGKCMSSLPCSFSVNS